VGQNIPDYLLLPRERLKIYGEKQLSNQELLAILLRTGTKQHSVLEVSKKVFESFNQLSDLKEASLEELAQIKGIGPIKAIEIKAVLELGARLNQGKPMKLGRVYSSQQIGDLLVAELNGLYQEHLLVLYLNTKNHIIKKETIFIGGLNQSIAHPREIFRVAVRCSAAKIILAHNHPSGDPYPSKQDIDFTERLGQCGELLNIPLIDHFVIGEESYISFKEEGLLF